MTVLSEGRFVRSRSNELGTGRLLRASGDLCTVEYFDSPAAVSWPRFEISAEDLEVVTLEDQTRAYYFDTVLGAWRMGRVYDHIDSKVYIQLPNKQQATVPEAEVHVRWNRPLDDPWRHVAAQLSETPYFHRTRNGLVRHLVRQRAASAGMTGLISSPVELHGHQIEVVRRVLTDPVKRYLLADEVGLGKTIEAGIILRQHLLDHPEGCSVLVIAPRALIEQWKSQLRDRCQVGIGFGHDLEFLPLEEVAGWADFQPDFIILDEAHQLTRLNDGSFETLKRLSDPSRCPSLLLLSATPVLRNERGFLALLHLLDPVVHDMDKLDAFRDRIAKRQRLADLFASFTEESDPYFLGQTAGQLAGIFPHDRHLRDLFDHLGPLLDDGRDEVSIRMLVRRIRVHLSETYRLHRRILRNRRDESIDGLMPGRHKLVEVPWPSIHGATIHSVLETWCSRAATSVWGNENSPAATGLARVFVILWEAAEADLEVLVACARCRLVGSAKTTGTTGISSPLLEEARLQQLVKVPLFDGEEELLENIIRLGRIADEHREDQLKMTRDVVRGLLAKGRRIVCIATSPALADALFKRLGGDDVVFIRHRTDSEAWREKWEGPGERVLVCDWRAEEGLNLQGGKCCLLHMDLPFSPNRIEQRMGRLDRFGVGGKVTSFALVPEGVESRQAWAACLDTAWQVFSRSIASLQYVVEEEMESLTLDFFLNGEDAIRKSMEKLSAEAGLKRELKLIRNQDALDSLEASGTGDAEEIKSRIEAYEGGDNDRDQGTTDGGTDLASVLDSWMCQCLKFVKFGERDPNDGVIRYHYRRRDHGENTLVSVSQLRSWFGEAIDSEGRTAIRASPLTYPIAVRRATALQRNSGVARLGNPVIEAIRSYLTWDDRGTSFALWRKVEDLPMRESRIFFRFDFIVETDLSEAGDEAATARLADAAFPPIFETIWIDQDLQLADEECLFELGRSYRKPYDTNLTPSLWPAAIGQAKIDDWNGLCEAVRSVAGRLLEEKHDLKMLARKKADALVNARAIAEEQISCRMEFAPESGSVEKLELLRWIERSRQLTNAIVAGIVSPRIRLDAAGVVILSPEALGVRA